MIKHNLILAKIARKHLGIQTLATRKSDSLDFYNVAVWSVADALKAAFDAGSARAIPPVRAEHSPAPWQYEYSPYTLRATGEGEAGTVGDELAAFEIFDAEGNKIFDTNEDTPVELQ